MKSPTAPGSQAAKDLAVSKGHAEARARKTALRIILSAIILIVAIGGVELCRGWAQYNRDRQVVQNLYLIDMIAERYEIDHIQPSSSLQAAIADGYSIEMPINPYTRNETQVVYGGTQDYYGEYSYYLALDSRDPEFRDIADHISVGFCPQPTIEEVIWLRLIRLRTPDFMKRFFSGSFPVNTQPQLGWVGGDCGNCMVYIARGLSPAEVLQQLRERFKGSDWYGYLNVVTPAEYATMLAQAAAEE